MVLLGSTDPLAVAIAIATAGLRRRPQEDVGDGVSLALGLATLGHLVLALESRDDRDVTAMLIGLSA